MIGLVICRYVSVFCKLSFVYCCRYLTIFLDVLCKLYVRLLSVKMFVKIVDFVFVYSGECVVNVA